jgi:hypothetical protein
MTKTRETPETHTKFRPVNVNIAVHSEDPDLDVTTVLKRLLENQMGVDRLHLAQDRANSCDRGNKALVRIKWGDGGFHIYN